jgi:hypothetical protein
LLAKRQVELNSVRAIDPEQKMLEIKEIAREFQELERDRL